MKKIIRELGVYFIVTFGLFSCIMFFRGGFDNWIDFIWVIPAQIILVPAFHFWRKKLKGGNDDNPVTTTEKKTVTTDDTPVNTTPPQIRKRNKRKGW